MEKSSFVVYFLGHGTKLKCKIQNKKHFFYENNGKSQDVIEINSII